MTATGMRVLHVIASLAPVHGGTTSSVLAMAKGLAQLGIVNEFATSDDDGPGLRLAAGAAERQDNTRHYFAKHNDFYTYTPSFLLWLHQHRKTYDLLHIHGLFSHLPVAAARIARSHGIPYVVTPHGMANHYGMQHKPLLKQISFRLFERSMLDGASAVHLTSQSEAQDFAELNVATPSELIPLAVDPVPHGNAEGFLARNPMLRNTRIVAFVGRLNPVKNIECLIDAVALVSSRTPEARFVICGDGRSDYVATLKTRAKLQRISDLIIWPGFLTGAERSDLLAAASIFVLPSHSESFGMSAVEAASAGLPCVLAHNVAVARDLAAAGIAHIVEPTSMGIANGIALSWILPDARFSARARDFVARSYAKDVTSAAMIKLYRMGMGLKS